MRLTPEAMAEAIRSMEKTAERHAKIQAAFKAAAPALQAKLNPDLYPERNSRKCWESSTLKAIYENDSLTQWSGIFPSITRSTYECALGAARTIPFAQGGLISHKAKQVWYRISKLVILAESVVGLAGNRMSVLKVE